MTWLIIYFFAGVLQDFLATLNVRYIAKNKILASMFSSFLMTIVGLLVLYNILTSLDSQKSIIAIIVYALGITFGTLLAMKFKIKEE
jgi:hypothetical protein